MPFVTTGDGTDVHYLDTGGDGPAVILVHDILLDADQWRPQMASLAPDYRVIAIDTRGHGETRDAGTPFDYPRLALDCWAVADALELREVVLGGLFHGGIVALWAARLAPARVRGLLLIGTRADAYNPEEYAGYKSILLKQWVLGTEPLEPIAPLIAAQMIGGDTEHQRYWLEKWERSDRRRLEQAIIALLDREGIENSIDEITAPALLLHGAGDVVHTDARMRKLAGQLGGPARVETIAADTATHTITWTHPQLTDPLIREFLDAL